MKTLLPVTLVLVLCFCSEAWAGSLQDSVFSRRDGYDVCHRDPYAISPATVHRYDLKWNLVEVRIFLNDELLVVDSAGVVKARRPCRSEDFFTSFESSCYPSQQAYVAVAGLTGSRLGSISKHFRLDAVSYVPWPGRTALWEMPPRPEGAVFALWEP